MKEYVIYTDGAYSPLYNKGGIAFIILQDDELIFKYSKVYLNTTSQRMEILAVIKALESINNSSNILIISDSQYVICTMTKGWKRKKNFDLWEKLDKLVLKHNVKFEWTKGHNNDKYNNIVDKLAQEASKELTKYEIQK